MVVVASVTDDCADASAAFASASSSFACVELLTSRGDLLGAGLDGAKRRGEVFRRCRQIADRGGCVREDAPVAIDRFHVLRRLTAEGRVRFDERRLRVRDCLLLRQ